jgi:hypothetical protein
MGLLIDLDEVLGGSPMQEPVRLKFGLFSQQLKMGHAGYDIHRYFIDNDIDCGIDR